MQRLLSFHLHIRHQERLLTPSINPPCVLTIGGGSLRRQQLISFIIVRRDRKPPVLSVAVFFWGGGEEGGVGKKGGGEGLTGQNGLKNVRLSKIVTGEHYLRRNKKQRCGDKHKEV